MVTAAAAPLLSGLTCTSDMKPARQLAAMAPKGLLVLDAF
jgi:hypothetical protein